MKQLILFLSTIAILGYTSITSAFCPKLAGSFGGITLGNTKMQVLAKMDQRLNQYHIAMHIFDKSSSTGVYSIVSPSDKTTQSFELEALRGSGKLQGVPLPEGIFVFSRDRLIYAYYHMHALDTRGMVEKLQTNYKQCLVKEGIERGNQFYYSNGKTGLILCPDRSAIGYITDISTTLAMYDEGIIQQINEMERQTSEKDQLDRNDKSRSLIE